ncbi:MAG: hypothetical protein QXS42_03560 [Zestosphaera sp.]
MAGHKINLNELKRITPGLLPTLNFMSMKVYGKSLSALILESSNGITEDKIRKLLVKIYQNEEVPDILMDRIRN